MASGSESTKNHAAFIWSVADLLRGTYKQADYGKVILPLTVLRRLDCVLEPTKAKVLETAAKYGDRGDSLDPILKAAAGQHVYNTSKLDFAKLLDDPDGIAAALREYISKFSPTARDVIEKFDFGAQIAKLDQANLLYLVISKFSEVDLHPDVVSNIEMGYLYEELVRRFSELSNETAGEHFTPREVIKLMVDLLFIGDGDLLTKKGIVKTLFDPACGTGGMLSVAEEYLRDQNPDGTLRVFGQELNAETYAVCRSDLLIKGEGSEEAQVAFGNSFTQDGFEGQQFDYLLANPPFGVEWKNVADVVKAEHAQAGFAGRFGAGLPRINDGSFLFLQHMISKMKRPEDGGSRLAIVFNGSPLFTGAAASGESEIRRWIIEHDWLEAVVALPDQLFYNTGISTYFWVVTNRKAPERRGKVQLVDARQSFTKMRKSLGEKRKQISDAQIAEIVGLYGDFTEGDRVKILPNESFGFLRISVDRPTRRRWDISDETIAAVQATKSYAALGKETLNVDPDRTTADVLDAALLAIKGTSTATADEMDIALGAALVAAWTAAGDAFEKEPKARAGMTAASLETTSAKAQPLLDALAVRDPDAEPVVDKKGNPEPDADLRDNENVPLPPIPVRFEPDVTGRLATPEYRQAIDAYVTAEVHPYVADAWVDHTKTKVGYEIPLTRHFYRYVPPRPLAEIDAEIKTLEAEIQALLAQVTE